ncbi:UNVERIFIED_CONTAM: hypothetical protein PYX00_011841 [Menopon gallinae]|uniref:Protein kinase domain-containing protein n=1 Tax=Menopon gallinae TaxID=328185 RepID=A0AAW2H8V4_9NEOP
MFSCWSQSADIPQWLNCPAVFLTADLFCNHVPVSLFQMAWARLGDTDKNDALAPYYVQSHLFLCKHVFKKDALCGVLKCYIAKLVKGPKNTIQVLTIAHVHDDPFVQKYFVVACSYYRLVHSGFCVFGIQKKASTAAFYRARLLKKARRKYSSLTRAVHAHTCVSPTGHVLSSHPLLACRSPLSGRALQQQQRICTKSQFNKSYAQACMIKLPFASRASMLTTAKRHWAAIPEYPTSSPFEDAVFISKVLARCILLPAGKSFLAGLFGNSGYTLLKLGQWMSTRRDVLPEKVCDILSRLRDCAPQHSLSETYRCLGMEDIRLGEVLGSGSVAQVYKARFNGKDVAVKVLHPGIRSRIEKELATITKVVSVLSRLSFFRAYDLMAHLDEFRRGFLSQCDMRNEAYNLRLLKKLNADVTIPEPIYASEHVLVESLVPFQEISSSMDGQLAVKCIDFLMRIISSHRLVHIDLHPGNVKRTEDGNLVLLDAGLCKYLTRREKKNLHDLVFALACRKNGKKAGDLLVERLPKNALADKRRFSAAFDETFQRHFLKATSTERSYSFFSLSCIAPGYVMKRAAFHFDVSRARQAIGDFHRVLSSHSVILDSTYTHLLGSLLCFGGVLQTRCVSAESGRIKRLMLRKTPMVRFLYWDFVDRACEPYILIEDLRRRHQSFYKEYEERKPTLSLNSPVLGCPFLENKKVRFSRKKETKSGMCEVCYTKYSDYRAHIQEAEHREFATDDRNYREIDMLIAMLSGESAHAEMP